jgi:uncharacterized protein (UPF0128 family)
MAPQSFNDNIMGRTQEMYNNYLIYYYMPTVHHFQIISIEQILYIPVSASMK